MPYESQIINALDVVLTWALPDEALPGAVQAEASLLAGCYFD